MTNYGCMLTFTLLPPSFLPWLVDWLTPSMNSLTHCLYLCSLPLFLARDENLYTLNSVQLYVQYMEFCGQEYFSNHKLRMILEMRIPLDPISNLDTLQELLPGYYIGQLQLINLIFINLRESLVPVVWSLAYSLPLRVGLCPRSTDPHPGDDPFQREARHDRQAAPLCHHHEQPEAIRVSSPAQDLIYCRHPPWNI